MSTTPRISPVIPGTRPELAALEARITRARGQISPLYQILLNSAPLVDGWEAMLTAIRQKTSVTPAAPLRQTSLGPGIWLPMRQPPISRASACPNLFSSPR